MPDLISPPNAPQVRVGWTHRLYARIYMAVLASLAVAALLFGAVAYLHSDPAQFGPSLDTFAEIASEVLPSATASQAEQQAALARWRPRVHADLALYAPSGMLIASVGGPMPPWKPSQSSSGWLGGRPPVFALKLPDERWLLGQRVQQPHRPSLSLLAALALIALAVAVGAYPIVRRLTRRLEHLQMRVDVWGSGQLSTRVAVEGQDEVALLASSFNRSAARIEALVEAQKKLLANASHELRSPLARIRMAVELIQAPTGSALQQELICNIHELDQLIDEILLTSRLDVLGGSMKDDAWFDLAALVAEECARCDAQCSAQALSLTGDAKLIRRLLRNLLENAERHAGGTPVTVSLARLGPDRLTLEVCDQGQGVPAGQREHIFAPFYRLPGARESDGGVGLGLSLVRQIARLHGGDVEYMERAGGGSCFRVTLPL